MKKHMMTMLKTVLGAGSVLYVLLFLVFYFDLGGKLVFHVVEPMLCKHYENMPRRDMTKMPYEIHKFPHYN